MIDSRYIVEDIIYDNQDNLKTPSKMDNLPYQIQTLVYLYKQNMDWEDDFKDDIREYVKRCIDAMEKI